MLVCQRAAPDQGSLKRAGRVGDVAIRQIGGERERLAVAHAPMCRQQDHPARPARGQNLHRQAAARFRAGGSPAVREPAPAACGPVPGRVPPNRASRLARSIRPAGRESRRDILHRLGKFLAPAVADGVGEVALEIAEEREGRLRAPFLAHEHQRRHRREQRDRERGFDRRSGSRALSSRSPSARLPIWSWFCRKLTKASGDRSPLGSPRDRAAAMRGGLALIGKARAERARDVLARRSLIVAVIAVRFRRSAAHARRDDSRRSIARGICRAADRSPGSSRLARLSSFSSTR